MSATGLVHARTQSQSGPATHKWSCSGRGAHLGSNCWRHLLGFLIIMCHLLDCWGNEAPAKQLTGFSPTGFYSLAFSPQHPKSTFQTRVWGTVGNNSGKTQFVFSHTFPLTLTLTWNTPNIQIMRQSLQPPPTEGRCVYFYTGLFIAHLQHWFSRTIFQEQPRFVEDVWKKNKRKGTALEGGITPDLLSVASQKFGS